MNAIRISIPLPIILFLVFSVTHAEETLDPTEPIPGDLNLDGNVNFLDFIILAENFGKSGPIPEKEHPGTAKLKKLYGIWNLEVARDVLGDFVIGTKVVSFMFGVSEEDEDGVPIIYGVDSKGLLSAARYDEEEEKYVIVHSGRFYQQIYTFEIQDKSWVGDVFRWTYGETRIIHLGKIKESDNKRTNFVHYDPESIYIRPGG